MDWFIRKGIFYRPASAAGWVIFSLAVGYLVWAFLDIDSRSHSASDTLINWFFNVLLVAAGYAVIGYLTERR